MKNIKTLVALRFQLNKNMYQLIEEASQVLRTPPPVFDFENPAEPPEEIAKNMAEAMEKFGGLGLSANQVGLSI